MYGDTAVIRRLAHQLRDQATSIRAEATALGDGIAAVRWTGRTADAMRAAGQGRLEQLARSAAKHDEAAAALDHHAAEVDRLKELIASIERRALDLVHDARQRLAGIAQGVLDGVDALVPDHVDQLLDRFVPPPPGHLDWLEVRLPGLGR